MSVSAERITAAEVARLADLGIEVTTRPPAGMPQPDFLMRSNVFLSTSMGVAAVVYPMSADETGRDWYVHPIDMRLLQPYIALVFGQQVAVGLTYYWTMAQYLMVFEGLAALLAGMGVPRRLTGDIWAAHAMLVRNRKRAPRDLGRMAVARARLVEMDVAPAVFYEHLWRVRDEDAMAATMALIEFEIAHPELHPSLMRELFA